MTNREIADIVRHQNPLTLPAASSVRAACEAMRERRVGAVLVVDAEGRLAGIFTGRDAVCRVLAANKSAANTTLADAMTRAPDTMPPGKTAVEAMRLMQDGGYRHVPIVDRGKLVGIISRGDIRGLEHARLDEETGIWERI